MTSVTRITHEWARLVMLASLGLLQMPEREASKADVLQSIRCLGALQIDTIHVVARSPYLVLWSRLGDYKPQWLDELQAEGALFEYWSHAACFLPIEEYPLYRRLMLDGFFDRYVFNKWEQIKDQGVIERVMQRIQQKGAVRSADFKRTDGKKGTWWDWKPEKLALEYLHNNGDLMIARRKNFQRYYDLRQRILPDWDDAKAPPFESVVRELVAKTVYALGITSGSWVPDYFRQRTEHVNNVLEEMLDEGILFSVAVDGWAEPAFVHKERLSLLEEAASGGLEATMTTLLSPFDPLVWDRVRLKAMFDFDYRLECYTPAEKRKYGYFLLPILCRGVLVGRVDAKAHRKEKFFEVKKLYLEDHVPVSDDLLYDIRNALQRCANWHQTPEIVIRDSEPACLIEALV